MKRATAFVIGCMCCISCCLAARVEGTVRSDKGEPLAGALVKAVDEAGEVLAYAIANAEGHYVLEVEPLPEPLRLVFSCMGYETQTKDVDNLSRPVDVRLGEKPFELQEVVVKVPPIRELGDTLIYDVASFRSRSDRNIEDVIKRLPGIEVQDNGQIFYNGEAINKFYIEGLDLLGGRYAIATRNISPDDIASVSIYENHQPIQALKDIRVSDRAALNLKLKNQRMLKPIGYVKGGAGWGEEAKWQGELFGMLIAPKNQTIITAKCNNFGEAYRNEMQSLTENLTGTNSLAYGIFSQTPFGKAQIPQSRYYFNRSAAASANTLQKLGEYLTLTFTADYLKDENIYDNRQVTDYYVTGGQPVRVVEENRSQLDGHEANFSLKVENNAPMRYVNNELRFKGRFNSNLYSLSGDEPINQTLRNNDYNLRNRFLGVFRTGRHVYEVSSQISLSNTPRNRIMAWMPERDSLLVSQSAEGLSFHTLQYTSFSRLLSSKASIGTKVSFESFYETFCSEGIQGGEEAVSSENDDYGYKLVTSAEPFFQLVAGQMTWRTEVPVLMYDTRYRDVAGGETYSLHRPFVEFRTSLYFHLPRNVKATLEGGRTYCIGGLEDFVVRPVYVTYRQRQTIGAGVLGVRRSDFVSASLRHRNAVKGIFLSMRGSYSRFRQNYMSVTDVDAGQTSVGQTQSSNKGNNANVMGNVSKRVRSLNTTFSLVGSAMFMKRKTQRQEQVIDISSRVYSLQAGAQSSFFHDRVSFSLDALYARSVQYSDLQETRTAVDDITMNASLSVYPLPRLEVFGRCYYNNAALSGNGRQNNVFADGGLRYSFGKFETELVARNLTNQKVYAYSQLNNYDMYTYSFTLRPLEVLASVKYNF